MEEIEKQHITKNLPKLLETILVTIPLLAYLQRDDLISSMDVEIVKSSQTPQEKVQKLLNILMGRVIGYSALISALNETKQSGAVAILNELYENSKYPQSLTVSQNKSSSLQTPLKYQFRINTDLSMHQVLTTLKPKFTKIMGSVDLNPIIIAELESLLIFDVPELQSVKQFSYRTELQRMNELMEIIARKQHFEVARCLEKLCDMEDLPKLSEQFRNIILEQFPGSSIKP